MKSTAVLVAVSTFRANGGPPLGLVGVEQSLIGPAACDQRQLPSQILRVAQAGVLAFPAGGALNVRRVAGQQYPAAAVGLGESAMDAELRGLGRAAGDISR
jgi:hypothetical protein